MRKIVLILYTVACLYSTGKAQYNYPESILADISHVTDTYRWAPYLAFGFQFSYADSATPTVHLQELQGGYQLHYGLARYFIDSTEFLHGRDMQVAVDHPGKTIKVNQAIPYHHFLNMLLTDSLQKKLLADTAWVSNVSDTMKVLTVKFHPGQLYTGYEMGYDPANYFIRYIKYRFNDSTQGSSGSKIAMISFAGRDTSIINEYYMWDGRFVYKDGSGFHVKPAYSNYTITAAAEQP